jgi:CBS-domain-containing membrane protein
MRIYRTTSQDVWNRVKVARRALRERSHRQPNRPARRHAIRARAYFSKMCGLPGKGTVIFPLEILWSFIGSFIGITILAFVNTEALAREDNLLLMGTFGASAMLLFGAPQVPFAQPRNVVGGHVVSALVGITVYTLCGEGSFLAPALGVAGAIAAMHATGTLHPPGGGTALMMATGDQAVMQYGYLAVLFPVATGAALLVAVALITNNLARDRRYPVSWW